MTPNWRQFSKIPWDETVADVVRALAVELPPEGRPVSFSCGGFIAAHTSAGQWVVMGPKGGSKFVEGPADVRAAAKLAKGTPSGDALRQWLEMWS
jgi:hypothetical protein